MSRQQSKAGSRKRATAAQIEWLGHRQAAAVHGHVVASAEQGRQLWDAFQSATVPDLAYRVIAAWSVASYPHSVLTCEQWRILFRAGGFAYGGVRYDPPAKPLTLYRGAAAPSRAARREYRRVSRGEVTDPALGWSWTESFEIAARYARNRHEGGVVYQIYAPPAALLARGFDDESVDPEWVVDTAQLSGSPIIVEADT